MEFKATFFNRRIIENNRSHGAELIGIVNATYRSLYKFGKTLILITNRLVSISVFRY